MFHLFSSFWIPFSFRGMCVACCSLDLIEVIMAQEDRWTLKILSLPVFSDEFSSALLKTPLANLAFVHAVDVKSESEFVGQSCSVVTGMGEGCLSCSVLGSAQTWSVLASSMFG